MKIFKQLCLFLLIFQGIQSISGQDLHFSQFNHQPLRLNPAYAGSFLGSIRASAIYRAQWFNASEPNYRTPSISADAPLNFALRKQDWIGVGVQFFSDQAGSIGLRRTGIQGNLAYHLALNKAQTGYLSLGASYGPDQYRVDNSRATFFDAFARDLGNPMHNQSPDFNRFGQTTPGQQGGQQGASPNNLTIGVSIKTPINKTITFQGGVAMANISRSRLTLLPAPGIRDTTIKNPITNGPTENRLVNRLIIHGNFDIVLNKKWTVSPTFLYQSLSPTNEIVVQGLASYDFLPEKEIRLNGGAGYRLGDAAHIILGMDWKSLRFGASYDITTSELQNANNGNGAIELAATYIWKIYKKPNVKAAILCPRFY
jgi:type IX secretion system PorP/SprF family membrane protein